MAVSIYDRMFAGTNGAFRTVSGPLTPPEGCWELSGKTVEAGANANGLYGTPLNDRIIAGDDSKNIFGEDGSDWITVGVNCRQIKGGAGNDFMAAGDGAENVYGDAGDDIINVGAKAESIYGGDGNDLIIVGNDCYEISDGAGDDTLVVGNNANMVSLGYGNDILVSNYTNSIKYAQSLEEEGINIVVGNMDTKHLDQIQPQFRDLFSALLRAETDDVLPLEFTSWERLGEYGIYAGDENSDDPVSLSSIWTLDRQTPALDIYKSFQNGVELEVELWKYKPWDFMHPSVISEKAIGEAVELAIDPDYYKISKIISYGEHGSVFERDGRWVYELNSAADSGPVDGPNIVQAADVVTVDITNHAGQHWEYDIKIDLEDDIPEVVVDPEQNWINFYYGADGAEVVIFANDQEIERFDNSTFPGTLVLQGEQGVIYFHSEYPEGKFGLDLKANLEYLPYPNSQGVDEFRFQITDNDGDMAMDSVAFSNDQPNPDTPVVSIDQLTFHEQNLAWGTAPDYVSLVKNGEMLYAPGSTVEATQIRYAGQTYDLPDSDYFNLTTSEGVFSAWHSSEGLSYSFILANGLAQAGDNAILKFEAILADASGNVYDGNMINVNIVDDKPVALINKVWDLGANGQIAAGNATEYFMAGADDGVFNWQVS